MQNISIAWLVSVIGIALGLLGILLRLNEILRRPFKSDLARPRGSPWRGVLYAFTLGMAPWEKESTRLHWLAYLRGIFFHVGVFVTFAILVAFWVAPFWQGQAVPQVVAWVAGGLAGLGAIFGFSGIPMRLMEPNARVLSLPDDYASVALTSLFAGLGCLAVFFPAVAPLFLVVSGILGVYVPISKIRHCVYFFYSKFFFGMNFGRRGVIGMVSHE